MTIQISSCWVKSHTKFNRHIGAVSGVLQATYRHPFHFISLPRNKDPFSVIQATMRKLCPFLTRTIPLRSYPPYRFLATTKTVPPQHTHTSPQQHPNQTPQEQVQLTYGAWNSWSGFGSCWGWRCSPASGVSKGCRRDDGAVGFGFSHLSVRREWALLRRGRDHGLVFLIVRWLVCWLCSLLWLFGLCSHGLCAWELLSGRYLPPALVQFRQIIYEGAGPWAC